MLKIRGASEMIAVTLEVNSILLTDLLDVLFAVDCAAVGTTEYRVFSH